MIGHGSAQPAHGRRATTATRRSARARRSAAARCRGSVYLAVLGTSMVVAMIGVSAIMVVRAQQRDAAAAHAAVEARHLAQSAAEMALLQLADTPGWRSTESHDQWSDFVALGGGETRYRLRAVSGSNLAADPASHVWLETEGRRGEAVRLARVALQPTSTLPGFNRVHNGDMKEGSRHWSTVNGDDWLELHTLSFATGPGSLVVRNAAGDVPTRVRQDVTGRVEAGQPYTVHVHLRMLDGTRDVHVRLASVNTDGQEQVAAAQILAVGETWSGHAVTLTPGWSGQLAAAHLEFRVDDGSDFMFDAVRLMPAEVDHVMVPVPGTWRQWVR